MARRKGDVWYIAGINGTNEPRTLCFSLKDLSVAGKKITLFEDGTDDRSFAIEENLPLSEDEMNLEIKCLPRGGFVAVINDEYENLYISVNCLFYLSDACTASA